MNGGSVLSGDLLETFANTNKNAAENLFQFAFSRKAGFTFGWGGFFMGYPNMSEALDVSYSGWNAFVTIPSAFDAYASNDLRKDATWEIYPIPHTQIAANPNLKQNPGYSQ